MSKAAKKFKKKKGVFHGLHWERVLKMLKKKKKSNDRIERYLEACREQQVGPARKCYEKYNPSYV